MWKHVFSSSLMQSKYEELRKLRGLSTSYLSDPPCDDCAALDLLAPVKEGIAYCERGIPQTTQCVNVEQASGVILEKN
jgi:hypothetical protein